MVRSLADRTFQLRLQRCCWTRTSSVCGRSTWLRWWAAPSRTSRAASAAPASSRRSAARGRTSGGSRSESHRRSNWAFSIILQNFANGYAPWSAQWELPAPTHCVLTCFDEDDNDGYLANFLMSFWCSKDVSAGQSKIFLRRLQQDWFLPWTTLFR